MGVQLEYTMKTICFYLAVLTFAVLISCVSNPSGAAAVISTKTIESVGNRLVSDRIGLTLPTGWSFHPPMVEDGDEVLFRFNDSERSIFGSIKRVQFNYVFDTEKVANYYYEELLSGYTNKQVSTILTSGGEIIVLSAQIENSDRVLVLGFFPVAVNTLDIIKIASKQSVLSDQIETVNEIFRSFGTESRSVRVADSGIAFYCDDDSWVWINDYDGGFFIRSTVETVDCVVGIWPTLVSNVGAIRGLPRPFDFTIPQASFNIENDDINS